MTLQSPLILKICVSTIQLGYKLLPFLSPSVSLPRYTRRFRHRSTRHGRTVMERRIDLPKSSFIRVLGCWAFEKRELSPEMSIKALRMVCNMYPLQIFILCVGSTFEPPTCFV